MTWIEFTETIRTVCTYYERKIPSDNALELWHERVKNVPKESMEWIERKIFEENDTFPKNLPSVIWALYNAWLNAHPDKRAYQEEKQCPDCEGGWIVLTRIVTGYKQLISFSVPCGRCKQVGSAYYRTLEECIRAGYERNMLKDHNAPKRTVKEMIRDIGKPVNRARVTWD